MSNHIDSVVLNTEHSMPLIGLGTYKITGDLMLPAIDAALAAGYRLFDTAKFYFNEAELGHALEVCLPQHNLRRENVFITTKLYPTGSDNFLAEIENNVEDSLKSFRTGYIDLVLIHFPKTKETELDDLKECHSSEKCLPGFRKIEKYLLNILHSRGVTGKIRSIGVSNYEVHHIEEIKDYGQNLPAVNQVQYHPHFTRDQLDYCDNNGIFFQAYSSLARQNDELLNHEIVLKLAEKYATSAQIILLSWAISQRVGVIPKSSQPTRIAHNLKASEIRLTNCEIAALKRLNRNKNYVQCEGWLVV